MISAAISVPYTMPAASRAPTSTSGKADGSTTCQNTCHLPAPRDCATRSCSGATLRTPSRAATAATGRADRNSMVILLVSPMPSQTISSTR